MTKLILPIIFPFILAISEEKLELFFSQNHLASQGQANQLSALIPYLTEESSGKSSRDKRKLLISRMLAGESLGNTEEILPMLIEDENSVDLKNFYLYQDMLEQGKIYAKNVPGP